MPYSWAHFSSWMFCQPVTPLSMSRSTSLCRDSIPGCIQLTPARESCATCSRLRFAFTSKNTERRGLSRSRAGKRVFR